MQTTIIQDDFPPDQTITAGLPPEQQVSMKDISDSAVIPGGDW